MKLYDYPKAPNPMRVNIFLNEKGIEIEKIFLDLGKNSNLDENYLKINPSGTVPYLYIDENRGISESIAICRYFESLHPNPPLFGKNAYEQGKIEMWRRKVENEGMTPIGESFRNSSKGFAGRALAGPQKFDQISALVERGIKRANLFFDNLNNQLSKSQMVAGKDFSIADIDFYVTCYFAGWMKVDPAINRPNIARWKADLQSRSKIYS